MKWNNNGVTYERGCRDVLIARYDNGQQWYINRERMTQASQKVCFKRLGEDMNARSIEVKPLFDAFGNHTETEMCAFQKMYDGQYWFESYSLCEVGRDYNG